MPNCENCIKNCPQANMAYDIAKGRLYAMQELCKIVKEIENGDLVHVVRCRDCEHFIDMSGTSYPSYCYKHTTFDADGEFDNVFSVEPDKYCAWGERRDGE